MPVLAEQFIAFRSTLGLLDVKRDLLQCQKRPTTVSKVAFRSTLGLLDAVSQGCSQEHCGTQ